MARLNKICAKIQAPAMNSGWEKCYRNFCCGQIGRQADRHTHPFGVGVQKLASVYPDKKNYLKIMKKK